MIKLLTRIGSPLVVGCIVALATPAFANHLQPDAKGNLTVHGTHYNLNIIGVEQGKNPQMTGSDRHTIFVALGDAKKDTTVITKIYLSSGPEFQVCDGNGFDAAYDCNGKVIAAGNNGATFQLPCNTHLTANDPGVVNTLLTCDEAGENQAAYEVFARALGSPKFAPQVTIKTCATEVVDVNGSASLTELCSTESVVLVRNTGKPQWKNVTQELTSLCVDDLTDPGTCNLRFALFRDEFVDWFWQYANQGVRLTQLRFYLLP